MSNQVDLYIEKDSLYKNNRDNRCRFQFTLGDTFTPRNLHKALNIMLNGVPIEVEFGIEFCEMYFVHRRCLRFTQTCAFAKDAPLNAFCHCPKAGTSKARVADNGYTSAAKRRSESAWNERMNKKARAGVSYNF